MSEGRNNGPEIPNCMLESAKEKTSKPYNYVKLPKRDMGSGNPVLDLNDLLCITKDDVKTSIPVESSKLIEGKFPESANTQEKTDKASEKSRVQESLEDKVEKFFGFSMEEKYEVKKEPERIRENNVIKIDFGNKKK